MRFKILINLLQYFSFNQLFQTFAEIGLPEDLTANPCVLELMVGGQTNDVDW